MPTDNPRALAVSDLKPQFLDLEDVRRKLGVGRDPEGRKNTFRELCKEIWTRFTRMSYSDLRALADRAEMRGDELRRRLHREADAMDAGEISDEEAIFDGQHHYYANLLKLRASLARQAMQAVEELGEVPEWEEVRPDVQERLANINNSLKRHTEAISIALRRKEPGTFGDKTNLYREASQIQELGEDATREYIRNHMEDEPESEREWREHLDMQS